MFQMYLVVKLVGKQTNQVTYSWSRFLNTVDLVLVKLIETLKQEAVKASGQDGEDLGDVELEIDNSFFKRRFVPLIH
jgi:hypothetical protein